MLPTVRLPKPTVSAPPAPPEPPPPPSRLAIAAKLIGATLVSLFILAITLPSRSKGNTDNTVFVFIFTPLVLICLGAAWSRSLEKAGWALLIILLLMRLAG